MRYLSRFTAWRCHCKKLHIDQGTHFMRVDAKLRNLLQEQSKSSSDVYQLVTNEGTEWHFNPPWAHFPGTWSERLILTGLPGLFTTWIVHTRCPVELTPSEIHPIVYGRFPYLPFFKKIIIIICILAFQCYFYIIFFFNFLDLLRT